MLRTQSIDCPYCGERIELAIDESIENQQYIEDCFVCCRPINVTVSSDHGGEINVVCRTDNET